MSLIFPTVGDNVALELIVNRSAGQDLVLKLYTNNITPAKDDTVAAYLEAIGFGYAPIALAGSVWSAAAFGSIAAPQQVFTFTGALGNVYGYYMVQVLSGILVYAERFSNGPYPIMTSGDKIEVTPTIQAN